MANSNDVVVLELRRTIVRKVCQEKPQLAARFWFIICKVLDSLLLEAMDVTFPGAWSKARQRDQMLTMSPTFTNASNSRSVQRASTVR